MSQITISDETIRFIGNLIENQDSEKAAIAEALSTATDARVSPITDDAEYINICTVLARYNRLMQIVTNL